MIQMECCYCKNQKKFIKIYKMDKFIESKKLPPRLSHSASKLHHTSTGKLVLQRLIRKINYLVPFSNSKGDDENIKLTRHDALSISEFRKYINEIEEEKREFNVTTGDFLDMKDIETGVELSDKDFKELCIQSAMLCNNYIRIFTFLENLSKLSDIGCVSFLPLYEGIGLNRATIIALVVVFFTIIFLQIICDWSKLVEKYSKIKYDFLKLCMSKNADRIDEYERLVISFRSSSLYSDTVSSVTVD